ncbi:MAG: hypothetical protein COZ77_10000 [Gallionellales bacterium CG_4_8_14_3_um_filter_54_18]|nr:MAG: hypothetical protein COZ77_10000 [Gallionellales bacterium CG_4_8_14_3_um_filter_54_18]PJC05634.1 MAG: hypothetical protein CO070_01580 [Gallionellales bacterium CG_4_9_14_0_8_um_filter_55_61]
MKINTRFLGLRLTVLLLFLGFAWLAFEQVTQEINQQWGKQFVECQVLFDKALYAAKAAGRNCVKLAGEA